LWSMDFPPAIALLAQAARAVGGDSLVGLRMVPALAGTGVVILAALVARELGGGWRAQVLAALCVIGSPLFLRSANLFQPVVLDQLTWMLALLALARLLGGYGPGSWLVLGLALGRAVARPRDRITQSGGPDPTRISDPGPAGHPAGDPARAGHRDRFPVRPDPLGAVDASGGRGVGRAALVASAGGV